MNLYELLFLCGKCQSTFVGLYGHCEFFNKILPEYLPQLLNHLNFSDVCIYFIFIYLKGRVIREVKWGEERDLLSDCLLLQCQLNNLKFPLTPYAWSSFFVSMSCCYYCYFYFSHSYILMIAFQVEFMFSIKLMANDMGCLFICLFVICMTCSKKS